MNKYAAIFVAFLAIGAYAATLDEARGLLDKLSDTATYDSERALKQLNGVANTIRQQSQNVLNAGSRLVSQEETRLSRVIQDIVASANTLKVNITSCLTKQGLLRELGDVANLEVVTCVDRYTNQATSAVSQGLGQLNGILVVVFELAQKLEKCQPTDSVCINSVVTQINFEENDIPRRIQEELDSAGNKAEAARLYLTECGVREAESLIIHGGELVADIQSCADKIIEGTPRP